MPSTPLSQLIIAGALLLCALWQWNYANNVKALMCGALAGILWMTVYCHSILSLQEVDEYSSLRGQTTPLTVRGKIISLVNRNGDWINIEVAESRKSNNGIAARHWRLGWDVKQLSPPATLLPQIGEHWQFQVRPRAFPSVLNQGGFNQQRYLLAQHITVKGSVISAVREQTADDWRASLLTHLAPILNRFNNGDILLALVMGERVYIDEQRWRQLRQSGTGHLVAISGLHLSVVALWLYGLSRFAFTRLWPTTGRRNLLVAQLLALAAAAVYAWLAGFGIPVQRALLMLLALILVNLSMRAVSVWERWLWAMAVVLLLDPLAPLSGGFWLSFIALALILWEWQRPRLSSDESWQRRFFHWFRQFWRIQWRLCLGLTLVQALLFGGISLHSFWINLLLVPWFSLVAIPLALMALLFWGCFSVLNFPDNFALIPWHLADWALLPANVLWQLSDHLPGSWVLLPWSLTLSLLFLLAAVLVWYWRPFSTYLWLPLLLSLPAVLQLGQWSSVLHSKGWQVHVLDVGQGLAVVVQQGPHALLFDTGASFPSGYSYAEQVVLPFLAAQGVWQLDYLLVSHGDNDHAGGAQAIMQTFPATQLITDVKGLPAYTDCRPKQWHWHALTLTILGPATAAAGNDGSCVLRVSDGQHVVLLPGDIELPGEVALLRQAISLTADILLAPHHGSRTSSTADFVAAVRPTWVVYPAGLGNRWQFPKPEVQARYRKLNSYQLVTGEQGQLSFVINDQGIEVYPYRKRIFPYWYNRLFGFGNTGNPE
ncbi:DNA internalization-related competence protein ComEC/Rec2 [Shewanella sp. A32]|uniref:DNA internalization-related competence protein ComEC/Rec2 n=1 Tax=Shewanella sp. A32 TaxID=3031327 RepID=UPI0023BA213A|nr:DNA internalization-related competence protein ComEC/Rec2 [Shewanella sp. A32]MDF0534279.1 DNA internalization-related competence protein ComEC/Rec2 [Shewanella sp. A32]